MGLTPHRSQVNGFLHTGYLTACGSTFVQIYEQSSSKNCEPTTKLFNKSQSVCYLTYNSNMRRLVELCLVLGFFLRWWNIIKDQSPPRTCACWGWSRPLLPHSGGWLSGPATTPHLRSPARAARPQTWSPVLDWGSHSPQSCRSQKEPWPMKEYQSFIHFIDEIKTKRKRL